MSLNEIEIDKQIDELKRRKYVTSERVIACVRQTHTIAPYFMNSSLQETGIILQGYEDNLFSGAHVLCTNPNWYLHMLAAISLMIEDKGQLTVICETERILTDFTRKLKPDQMNNTRFVLPNSNLIPEKISLDFIIIFGQLQPSSCVSVQRLLKTGGRAVVKSNGKILNIDKVGDSFETTESTQILKEFRMFKLSHFNNFGKYFSIDMDDVMETVTGPLTPAVEPEVVPVVVPAPKVESKMDKVVAVVTSVLPRKEVHIQDVPPKTAHKIHPRDLGCLVCNRYLKPPTFICFGGHMVCCDCKPKFRKCPSCYSNYSSVRNTVVDNIVGVVKSSIHITKWKDFECPVCLVIFDSDTSLCLNGHMVCSKCKRTVDDCPVCQSEFSLVRNVVFDSFMASLKVPCSGCINGCTTELKRNLLNIHEDNCSLKKQIRCLVRNCTYQIFATNYVDHVLNEHSAHFEDHVDFPLTVDLDEYFVSWLPYRNTILHREVNSKQHFECHIKVEDDHCLLAMKYLGERKNLSSYNVTVTLTINDIQIISDLELMPFDLMESEIWTRPQFTLKKLHLESEKALTLSLQCLIVKT